MNKFEVHLGSAILDTYFISDGKRRYMHRDGEIVYDACEYWTSHRLAQAVLDEFQPKHVWKHGDVFRSSWGSTMIYIILEKKSLAYCVQTEYTKHAYAHPNVAVPSLSAAIEDATFLFNIKDKL